ncbi:MAG TPA: hypothetical protein VNR51_03280, partial [Hyphomicrobium sp.]|nr:hypothetical protein [Hyphomicrobium sp.]
LQPLDDLNVGELAKVVAPALTKRTALEVRRQEQAARTAARAKSTAANKAEIVARYLQELEATKSDNIAFEQVISRLEKDRAIKTVDIEQIAQRFTSSSAKYRTKRAAAKAMLNRQIADRRAEQRSSQVSGIF